MTVPSNAETRLLAVLDRTLQGQLPDLACMVFERAAAALRNSGPLTRDLLARLRIQREAIAEDDRDAFDAALAALERAVAVPRTQIIRPPTRQAILVTPEEPEAALRMFPTRFSQAPSGVYQIHTIVTHRAINPLAHAVEPERYVRATYSVVYSGAQPAPGVALTRLNGQWAALAGHTGIPAVARLAAGVADAAAAWERACALLGCDDGEAQARQALGRLRAGAEPELARLLDLRGHVSVDQILAAMYELAERLDGELAVSADGVTQRVQSEFAHAIARIAHAGDTIPGDREARAWLLSHFIDRNPLAAKRFATREEALVFVARLYTAGAQRITVEDVRVDAHQTGLASGPTAGGLVVTLPEDRGVTQPFWHTLESEVRDHGMTRPEEQNSRLLLRWS